MNPYTLIAKKFVSELVPVNPSPVDSPIQPSSPPFDLDALMTLRKGKWSCTDHLISNFASYDHLTQFHQIALSLSFESISKSCEETLLVPAWKQAMNEEMDTLISRETRELVSALNNAVVVGKLETMQHELFVQWKQAILHLECLYILLKTGDYAARILLSWSHVVSKTCQTRLSCLFLRICHVSACHVCIRVAVSVLHRPEGL